MIDDILKDRTEGQKPRFFLHDEMKEWLTENLEIKARLIPNQVTDYSLSQLLQRLNIYGSLTGGVTMEISASIAGNYMPVMGTTASFNPDISVMYSLLKDREDKDQIIATLRNQINYLKTDVSACMEEITKLKEQINKP